MSKSVGMMAGEIGFNLRIEGHGWAYLYIDAAGRRVTVRCSYLSDALGELVAAFAKLTREEGSVEVTCYAEPGDVLLRLRRSGDRFLLVLTHFSWEGDAAPRKPVDRAMRSSGSGKAWERMSKARSKKAALRYEGPWLPAVSGFAFAFDQAVKAIGQDRYRESWGHPFPTEAWAVLSGFAGG